MKTKQLKTPLGLLTFTFNDLNHVIVELPKETPAEVNRVPLYFDNRYILKDGKWQVDEAYCSFYIPSRWGKEVSKATRSKVHDIVLASLQNFCETQPIFMLGVKLESLQDLIKWAHGQQEANNKTIQELQQKNLELQSQLVGWMVQITESRATFKQKKD